MVVICWGNLAKSAESTEKIEQAIGGYIESHDENPNAHMGEGYALGAHRLQTILDHQHGSIDFKYLATDKVIISSCFESLDGWNKTAGVSAAILGTSMITGASEDDEESMVLESSLSTFKLNYTKNPFFQTSFWLGTNTSQYVFVGMGLNPEQGDGDNFGYYINNGTLYAIWTSNYVTFTHEIAGITITELNTYRAYYDTDEAKLYFYINGVLKHTVTEDLPYQPNSFYFNYYIRTETTAMRYLWLVDFYWQMDR